MKPKFPHVNPEAVRTLPALKGTPKQVSWASVLRLDMLDDADRNLEPELCLALRTIADATWWIANREREPYDYRLPVEWDTVEEKSSVADPDNRLANDMGIAHESDLDGTKHWTEGSTLKLDGKTHTIGRLALVHNPDRNVLRLFFFDLDGKLIYVAKEMTPA